MINTTGDLEKFMNNKRYTEFFELLLETETKNIEKLKLLFGS
jgi:hypothetical protein